VIPVETAEDMRRAVLQVLPAATLVIKAAAVADYRVTGRAETKMRSGQTGLSLALAPNPDILAEVARQTGGRFVVGFAAETGDLRANARAKLESKGIDLVVANDVGRSDIGFDVDDNEVVLLDRWGHAVDVPKMPKLQLADVILDRVQTLRRGPREGV
jgi:phosphopantothenoylcysteine decarboxylase/phosphopantothenate--cysteine ligase